MVGELMSFAKVTLYGNLGKDAGILQRAEDSSYRELLAICGIDEQENA